MVFGQKAYDDILPWLRTNYSQKFLIQNVFLSHPQNIQWRYTYDHARNYIETFRSIMNLLGVDIPPLEGVVQLRFLMTKKRTLEMMECDKEFVDSEVLEAVQQRTDKIKIARRTKVEEIMKALKPEEVTKTAKRMAAVAVVVAVAVAAVAAAAAARRKEIQEALKRKEIMEAVTVAVVTMAVKKRKTFLEFAGSQPSCVRLCNHVGCLRSVISNGFCRGHGPRYSHAGCTNDVYARGVCNGHGPRYSHAGCTNDVYVRGVCRGHDPKCSHTGCTNDVYARGVCKGHDPRCSHMRCTNAVFASVDLLFFGTRKCVPVRTFLLFLAHEFLRRG